jgi:hypothetical protein
MSNELDSATIVEDATTTFLQGGGVFRLGIAQMKKDGRIPRFPVIKEYPKEIKISEGEQTFYRETETCKGTTIKWADTTEVFRTVIVYSEEEEERVLSGGQSSVQIEAARLALIQRCRNLSIPVDPNWSAVRLRRELGDKLDAPEETKPADRMGALQAELDTLRRMADMQAEIDALKARLAPKDDTDDEATAMRAELEALGVKVDGRWSNRRLRDELERATAPSGRAA